MVMHNQQAVMDYAYECAHASDPYIEEEDSLDELDYAFFTCPWCHEPAFFRDGYWTCNSECWENED